MGNKLDNIKVETPRDELIKIIFKNYPDYEIYEKLPKNDKLITILYDLTNYKKLSEFHKFKIGDYKVDDTRHKYRYKHERLGPIKAGLILKFSKFNNELSQKCDRCGKIMKVYSESGDTYSFESSYSITYICQDKYCGMWHKEDYSGKCIIF